MASKAAAPKGVWQNQPEGVSAVLVADQDGQLFDVMVEGATQPVPVMAKTQARAAAVAEANGLAIASIVETGGESPNAILLNPDELAAVAAGTVEAPAAPRPAKPDPKPGKSTARTNRRAAAKAAAPAKQDKAPAVKAGNGKTAADQLSKDAAKLWQDAKFSPATMTDAGARRKAIAKKLGAPGRIMGALRAAGIDGKVAPSK